MRNFIFNLPVKIYFGKDEFDNIQNYIKDLGKKPLIMTMEFLEDKTDFIKRLKKAFNNKKISFEIYNNIVSNPRAESVDNAARIFLEKKCDYIIAVGGGSVMDAAKAVSAVAKNGGKCSDYIQGDKEGLWENHLPIKKAFPVAAVPTLAATGSEANNIAVITNFKTKEKGLVFGDALFPKIAVIDPVLTFNVPSSTTSDGACDIISHNIESYLAGEDNADLQDRMSEGFILSVLKHAPIAIKDNSNYESRAVLSWASTVALSNFLNVGRDGAYPMHFIQHCVAGYYDIYHGKGIANFMPAYFLYTLKRKPNKYASLAKYIFNIEEKNDIKAGEKFINSFIEWLKSVNNYQGLKDLGIGKEKFGVIADDVLRLYGNGKELPGDKMGDFNKEDILNILNLAFNYK